MSEISKIPRSSTKFEGWVDGCFLLDEFGTLDGVLGVKEDIVAGLVGSSGGDSKG